MSNLFMDIQNKRLHRAAAASSPAASVNGIDSNSSTSLPTITANYRAKATTVRNGLNNDNDNDNDNDTTVTREAEDALSNTLSLKLKKPKHWKWELSTSRSCSNIALPRILLYDHKGTLLVDANTQGEQVYKQVDNMPTRPVDAPSRMRRRSTTSRAATTNLTQAIRQALDYEFDSLQIHERTPSQTPSAHSVRTATTPTSIDFYTNDLPDYNLDRRSSSLKSVRFKVDDSKINGNNDVIHLIDLPTPPSTTTATSSSSGPREKRRYRRSNSSSRLTSRSESILERFSLSKGRFSSPEFAAEEEVVRHAPRYFLRTSKAGTLVVQEESFSRYRRRPKQKNSSSENVQNGASSLNCSKNSLRASSSAIKRIQVEQPKYLNGTSGGSLHNVTEARERVKKKVLPMRRYRSDVNVQYSNQNSTSDEEEENLNNGNNNKSRLQLNGKYYRTNKRNSRREIVTVDPDNHVFRQHELPTMR